MAKKTLTEIPEVVLCLQIWKTVSQLLLFELSHSLYYVAHLGTLHVKVHLLSVHDNLVPEHHLVEAVLLGDVLRCEVKVEGLDVPVEQRGKVSLEIKVDEGLVIARVVIVIPVPRQA